jgi:DNA-binding winged helix-turn-helix (wHTH) protein/tetratricopeptide (TPR) repeat protein
MSLKRKEIFEFGKFRLDVDEHTIERRDGTRNGTLTGKSFQVLVLLVRRHGHLVTREELIRYVWPDTIVEDNNLEKCVHHLRHYLGETADGPKYIDTVRKHGYRFVEKVEAVEVSSSWLPETFRTEVATNGSAGSTGDQPAEPKGVYEKTTEPGRNGIRHARYPFSRVFVIAGIALVLIAAITGLGYYRLIRPRELETAVVFQPKSERDNAEAHQLYMMAMNLSEERGVQNVLKSLEYLERAVVLDPNYALAWAAIAHAHNAVLEHTDTGPQEHYQRSMEAITKALAIDPNLSEAYSALCYNKNRYEYDAAGAEKACKRALELDSNAANAHKTYANFLYSRGRFDEAIAEIKTAMDIQPVSYRNQQIYALTLFYARRYAEAEEQFKRLLELNPNHTYIHGRLIRVLEQEGKESEAFEYLIKMLTIQNTDNNEIERFKRAYRTSGWLGVVVEQIKTAEASANPINFQLACLHAKIGNKAKALEYLEKAFDERSRQLAILKVEPQLDSLRGDPRYIDIMKRVEDGGL